ncbi:hypothetical protein BKA63DRAFT_1660 [Paraphoma chrysanthemicola]|nr:hypothetical protein BKA63DRAFT_1660 [Paraphoma chrysanthemicola]
MSSRLSEQSTTDASELSAALARLGLSQYEERLRQHGFEDWETVTAITEIDMAALDFKRGDRRKLQRAIREHTSSNTSREESVPDYSPLLSGWQAAVGEHAEATPEFSQQAVRTTRPYRRHPRPDPNAPHKPKTAYVLFGEHVRQDPALSRSSFTDIAKETGRRWRDLTDEERVNTWEAPANDRLEKYKEELVCYKGTEEYRNYQMYLEEFKQQQHHSESMGSSHNKSSSAQKLADSKQPPVTLAGLEATYQERMDMKNQGLRSQSPDTASPTQDGLDEVRSILKALRINTYLIRVTEFPQEYMTARAVKSFLDGTGSLLFLWNREEAEDLVRSVYHPRHDSKPAHAAEVFAMSAVGSYCDAEAHTPLDREKFLHLFLYMLSSPLKMCDLCYMRLLMCLAICRFTNDVDSARRLMLSALDLGRQAIASPSFQTEASEERRDYWRNVFRSLVFLESWFAYNTTHESRVTKKDLTLYHSDRSHTEHERDAFHDSVGELGRLAAYIALDLKTANQLKAALASAHFESLNQWHHTLPPPMQLSRLSLADPLNMNWSTKRSLLQLHILFLGLLVEPFRDHLIDVARLRLGEAASPNQKDLDAWFRVEEQCVLAARQSARVTSLLQIDNLIRSHCWVSIYTSFTACSVLLLSASQKLLQLCGEEASQELSYAAPHLSALSFCGYDNALARKLAGQLQIVFNDIRETTVSSVYRELREKKDAVKVKALEPHFDYGAIEGAEEVRQAILGITRSCMDMLREASVFKGNDHIQLARPPTL